MKPKSKTHWSLENHPIMSKPKNDDEYLETLARVIFSAGLNWTVIEKKWPDIKKLFVNFSVKKVAKMNELDKEELMKDPRMIRNLPKINAIINNANSLLTVKKDFGSIDAYIQSTKKIGEQSFVKDLGKRFAFLGPSTALMFLYGIGEKIPETMKKIHE